METRFIRLGLLISILWLAYYNMRAFVVTFTTPSEETTSAFSGLMTAVSTLMLGLPLILILVWALYNLKSLRWLNDQNLLAAIKVVLIVSLVSLIVSTAVYFGQSAPYLPNIYPGQFMEFLKLMDWLPYTIAELSLLGFAYRQLKLKIQGDQMTEMPK